MLETTLEITRTCPLNCLICSSNGGKPHQNELKLDEWLKVIDDAIDLGANSFLISGGEPFCSSFLKEICKHISERKRKIAIYTSGNIIKKGKVISLEEEDYKDILEFSPRLVFNIQGPNEEIHEAITCKKNSFKNAIASISNAIKLGLITEIHFVPVLLNYQTLPEVVSLAEELGVKKVSVLRFVAQERGSQNDKILELEEKNVIELKKILSNISNQSSILRIGTPFSAFGLTKNYECTAGKDRMTIRFDGLVVPCEGMKFLAEQYNDNNIREKTLREIWDNSKLFKDARTFQNSIVRLECEKCGLFIKCKGGCSAQIILLGRKNLKTSEPYCIKTVKEVFV